MTDRQKESSDDKQSWVKESSLWDSIVDVHKEQLISEITL